MKPCRITDSNPLASLADAALEPAAIAECVADQPELLPRLLDGLAEPQARVKFGSAKVLLLVSGKSPETLRPYWSRLVSLLDCENKLLLWSALLTLGNLGGVMPRRRVAALLPRLLAFIHGPVMITAGNAMRSATCLALAHPGLADVAARGILPVEQARYQTAECRNIALGHAIQALDPLFGLLKDPVPVREMVRRQLRNSRHATRLKAAAFLKKHGLPPGATEEAIQ